MPIRLVCSACNRTLNVPDKAAGKKIRCPECQAITVVEAPGAAPRSLEPDAEPPPPELAVNWRRRKVRKAKPIEKPGFLGRLFSKPKGRTQEECDWMHRVAMDADNVDLRLDFADWLIERGHPLGELIWIEYETDQMPEDSEEFDALNDKRNEILDGPVKEWFKPLERMGLKPMIGDVFFPYLWLHHGLPARVEIDRSGILPEKAGELFAAFPALMELSFSASGDWQADIPAIVALPQMKQMRVLELSAFGPSLEDLDALASSPHLQRLVELEIANEEFGPEGVELLASSKTVTGLRKFSMTSSGIGSEGARILAGSRNFAALTSLNLGWNQIGPEGVAALAASPHLARLEELDLDHNEFGPEGATIGRSPHLRRVRTLKLASNQLRTVGLRTLLDPAFVSELTELDLSFNDLDSVAGALLAGVAMPKLVELDIASTELGPDGARALASARGFRSLVKLRLGCCKIGDEGLKALLNSSLPDTLEELDLSENDISPAGIQALAASSRLSRLTSLSVQDNRIGMAGAKALAKSPHLTNLENLWVTGDDLEEDAREMLSDRFGGDVVNL